MQIGVLAPPCQAALLRSEREHPFPMGKGDTPYSGAGVWSWGPGVREYSASVRVKNCPWLWAVFEERVAECPLCSLGALSLASHAVVARVLSPDSLWSCHLEEGRVALKSCRWGTRRLGFGTGSAVC